MPNNLQFRRCGAWGLLLLGMALTGCSGATETNRLRLAGGQIPLELIEGWLERSGEPTFAITRVQPVYLSQHGFQALARGECDLACTDRAPSARELEDFGEQPPTGRRLGFYGFAFYVNTQNKLDGLYSGHIELLLKRRIVDWRELGSGVEGPISLYGPRKNTRGGELLARQAGIWFAEPTWTPCENDAQVLDRVRADPLAMGFAGIGQDGEGLRYVGLRMERRAAAVLPSLEAIEDDRYALAKVIYVYWREPAAPPVERALAFLSSPAGQRAIEQTEVWPIPPERSAVAPRPAAN